MTNKELYSLEIRKMIELETQIEILENAKKKAKKPEELAQITRDLSKLKREWKGQYNKVGAFYE